LNQGEEILPIIRIVAVNQNLFKYPTTAAGSSHSISN
jgi:hypothetical protein